MKALLVLGGGALFIYLLLRSGDWSESSNKLKSNIGCSIMALAFILMFILGVLGLFKECTSISSTPIDYYDSPRK